MSRIPIETFYAVDEAHAESDGNVIATMKDASPEAVKLVVNADPDSDDGRSQWVWLRLQNGDLILGVFPQGDTYCDVEKEAP